MAITNEVDLTHIARTTEQWENTYDRNVIIPEGVLCIEFTSSGKTNIKIGDGHHIFSRLPYVNGTSEIIDCYTKQETDNRIIQILNNECVVRIKGVLDDVNKLPVHAACGDLWFVIRQNPEQGNKFEEYLYSSEHNWELVGGTPVDIDLSKYATKEYVDGKIRDIESKLHTHDNKSILDQITAAFTKEEKEKLKNLYNYDDTELRELIAKSLHTHSNKEVLDAITKYDIDKLRTLENYDDTLLKKKITALEALAHEHSNKSILDKTTASFTTDYERLMSLIRLYIGATGFDDGAAGLVPPAKAGEQNYVLTGSGKWVPNTGGNGETYELPIASATKLGGIKIGEGLEISEDGTLTVVGGGGGSGSGGGVEYHEGDGIQFKQETGKALYQVLDYIEATGTQRIDTDIMLSGTSHVVDITYQLTDITVDNYVYTVGGIFDVGGQVYGILTTSTKELCSGICQSGTAYEYVSIAPPTEKTTDSYFVNATSFGSTLTGSKNHNITVLNETISFFGFIRNEYNSYLGKVKLYSCDVKCDDVIIASFIPVMRISDSVYGLYDTISKKFFTNTYNETPFVAGTQTGEVIYEDITTINVKPATNTEIGGVIIGDGLSITEEGVLSATASTVYNAGKGISITKGSHKIPVEYQEIEYIESAGDAIFDTGYLVSPSTVIDMDCIVYESSKADWQFLYGSRSSTYDTATVFGFVVRNYHKGYVPELWISGEQLGTSSTFPYNERTILKQNMNELTWYPVSTEVPVTITGTGSLPTSSTTLAVSGFKDGSTYTFGPKCRIYSLKISDVNGITRDYVPCYRISDGVVGLYDLINDTFRYSATSTAFISGPVVSDSGGSTDDEKLYINNTGLLDANLKEDSPGVIIVSKSDETKELDVFQYISGLEVYCVEDSI